MDVIKVITDEFRVKRNLKALIEVMKLNSSKTTIDFESNIIKVELKASLKGLEEQFENQCKLDMLNLGSIRQGHRVLTSGITPTEYRIMHRQLKIFQNADNECEFEGIDVHTSVV
jgi:hypothetical protein